MPAAMHAARGSDADTLAGLRDRWWAIAAGLASAAGAAGVLVVLVAVFVAGVVGRRAAVVTTTVSVGAHIISAR